MKPIEITDTLLEKYLQDLCSAEEKEAVEKWYASLQANPDYLSTLNQENRKMLKEEMFLDIQLKTITSGRVKSLKSSSKWWAPAIAASILLCLTLSYFYLHNEKVIVPAATDQVTITVPEVQSRSFTNNESRMVLHTLPDGSTVWMHPDARIDYPGVFDKEARKVSFSGEGFFDIKKDPERPFSIATGEMTIRVLGTSFNVKAPKSNKLIQVSVLTGSVEVSAPATSEKDQMVVLAPQQHAIFEHNSKLLLVKSIPVPSKKEIYEPISIRFVEEPLSRVINLLEKKFNINIQLSNEGLARCIFTGDFEDQSLAAILEMLCISLEASYTISDGVILINGTPCD